MRSLRLCFSGFGAVGQRFAKLLLERKDELETQYNLYITVTGISTPSRGTLINPHGLICVRPGTKSCRAMVTSMLNEAFAKILDGINLILHSDQSWQYQRMLREKSIRWSVSLKEEWSGQ